jgi:predicted ATPase/DNA-binding CsgD family transcriptional regulator
MAAPLDKSVVCPVLIGRVPYLEALNHLLKQVGGGREQTILIAGEAGIGKSRLVAETKIRAAQQDYLILQGNCFELDRSLPYAPLLDLLRTLFAAHFPAEISHFLGSTAPELVKLLPELTMLLPDLAPSSPLESEQEKRRLFQALLQFFIRLNALGRADHRPPLLLIIEDLHWSDDTSLEFLLYLARQITTQPILLLLTYRSDETHSRLTHFLAGLDREHLALEWVLSRLTSAEVDAMIQTIFELGRPVYPEFLEPIYTLTEGNPFFIEEVLKVLLAAGEIFYADGAWTRKPMGELHIPRSVQDAVQRRVEKLSPTAKRLLTFAAVAGQRFDFALLQQLTQHDEDELVQLLKELIAAQLIVEESAEQFAFRHALARQAIYTKLLARERKGLHRHIAETMERLYADSLDTHLADLAYHSYEAGVWPQALAYSLRAAEKAARLFAHNEALSHYERACASAEALHLPDQLAVIYEGMANVYALRGPFHSAVESYDRALSLAPTTEKRAALRAKIGRIYALAGDERGFEILYDALHELNPTTQTNELAVANAMLGRLHHYRGQYTQAIEFLERARQLAEPLDDAPTLGDIYAYLAGAYVQLARFDKSMDWARRGVMLGERKNYPLAAALGYEFLGMASFCLGNWPDTLVLAARARELGQRIGSPDHVAWAEFCHGVALYGKGDLLAAVAAARTAVEMAEEIGDGRLAVLARARLVLVEADAGAEEAARTDAELALARADELGQTYMQSEGRWGIAYLYLRREAYERAASFYEQYIEFLAGMDNRCMPLLLGADHAEAYCGAGRLDEAAQIVAEHLTIAREAQSRHYEAVARRVQGQIFTAQGLSDEAGQAFDEAIATFTELGSRLELGRAFYHCGRLRHILGHAEAAHVDWTRARALFQETGAKPMLWRTYVALGQLDQAQGRAEEAEAAFAAARTIVAELAADISDVALRSDFLQRTTSMIPHPQPISPRRAAKREFGGLTAREREVAALIAQGQSNHEIAEALVISHRTVESHASNILTKLGFSSRTQIVAWAIAKGLAKNTE